MGAGVILTLSKPIAPCSTPKTWASTGLLADYRCRETPTGYGVGMTVDEAQKAYDYARESYDRWKKNHPDRDVLADELGSSLASASDRALAALMEAHRRGR